MPTSYSWLLTSPPTPTTPGGGSSSGSSAGTVGALALFTRKRGIITPFRRDQKNDFANGGGKALLRSHLQQILGVRAGNEVIQGEYRWRSDFGSLLELIRHRPNDVTTRELARTYVITAVSRWTKSLRVTGVDLVELDTNDGNVLVLRVWFEVTERGIRESDSVDVELSAIGR